MTVAMRSVPGAVATGFFYASTDSMTAKENPVATAPGTDLIWLASQYLGLL